MGGPEFAIAIITILMGMIIFSIPIVISLGLCSYFGLAYLTGSFSVAGSLLSNTAYESIREYVFAVIPLFVLMGEFIAQAPQVISTASLTDLSKGFRGVLLLQPLLEMQFLAL
jgi:hypothetical protein